MCVCVCACGITCPATLALALCGHLESNAAMSCPPQRCWTDGRSRTPRGSSSRTGRRARTHDGPAARSKVCVHHAHTSHTRTHTGTLTHRCTDTHRHTHTRSNVSVHTHTHTYTRASTHTHTHTHTQCKQGRAARPQPGARYACTTHTHKRTDAQKTCVSSQHRRDHTCNTSHLARVFSL